MKTNSCPITLVGASQSGKTTLAAGLAKTSDEAFTVGFADDATRDYLQPRIANISSGRWPEATLGENFDISLNLNAKGGRTATIAFKEYMGEKIRDQTYMEDIVGKPRGTLILMSPGMDILRDAARREEMIANLKSIIDYLKNNHCVAVAFVVTACDRLKTDLADFAPKFEEYAAEVTNYLNTSGMVWKRFDVTITGELDKQNEPTIAAGDLNTSREPFIWIMDRVLGRKRMLLAKHASRLVAGIVAAAVVAAAAGYGILYYLDTAKLKGVENDATAALGKIGTAEKNKRLAELNTGTVELYTAITNAEEHLFHFAKLDDARKKDIVAWRDAYDQNRAVYLDQAMDTREENMARDGSEDDCKAFDELLAGFAPTNTELKTELTNRWTDLRPRLRDAYDERKGGEFDLELAKLRGEAKDEALVTKLNNFQYDIISKWTTQNERKAALLREVVTLRDKIYEGLDTSTNKQLNASFDDMEKYAADKATAEAVEALRKEIADWAPHTPAGRKMKEELESSFTNKCNELRLAYEDRVCGEDSLSLAKSLGNFTFDDNTEVNAIQQKLQEICDFSGTHLNASQQAQNDATQRLDKAVESFIGRFADSFTTAWKPDDPKSKEPSLDPQNRGYIKAALDIPGPKKVREMLSERFFKVFDPKLESAQRQWKEASEKACNGFIKLYEKSPATTVYENYRAQHEWYCNNPHWKKNVSNSFIEHIVRKNFRNFALNQKTSDFEEFSKLCLAVAKDPCGLEDSWMYRFARRCLDEGKVQLGLKSAFPQTFTITSVEATMAQHKFPSMYKGTYVEVRISVDSDADPRDGICIVEQTLKEGDQGQPRNVLTKAHELPIHFGSSAKVLIKGTDKNKSITAPDESRTLSVVLPYSAMLHGSVSYTLNMNIKGWKDRWSGENYSVEVCFHGTLSGKNPKEIYNECGGK